MPYYKNHLLLWTALVVFWNKVVSWTSLQKSLFSLVLTVPHNNKILVVSGLSHYALATCISQILLGLSLFVERIWRCKRTLFGVAPYWCVHFVIAETKMWVSNCTWHADSWQSYCNKLPHWSGLHSICLHVYYLYNGKLIKLEGSKVNESTKWCYDRVDQWWKN